MADVLVDIARLIKIPNEDHTIIGGSCDLFALGVKCDRIDLIFVSFESPQKFKIGRAHV